MSQPFTEEQKLEWKEKIQQQQTSGLSIEKWCRRNQIIPHQFYYWKAKLFPRSSLDRSSFTELCDLKGQSICIEYNGAKIHLSSHFDAMTFKRCLSVLREIKC